MRLMQAVTAEMPRVQAPLLAVYWAHYHTAPPEDGQWLIYHAGGSAGKAPGLDAGAETLRRLVVLEDSDHFGMFGPDRNRLLGEVEAFVGG